MSPADLSALSDEELAIRREELADSLAPLWLRFDALEDEAIRRRRAARDRAIASARRAHPEPAAVAVEENF